MHQDRKLHHFLLFHNTLSEFYLMLTLRSFGLAMVNLFLPIFIYSLRNSLLDVISFLFFLFISIFLFFPLAGKLASKIGHGHTMLFSAPFTIIFFAVLYFFNLTPELIPFVGILYGFSEAFFWMSFHAEFSAISKDEKIGKEVGLFRGIYVLTSLSGPIIGGLVITFVGFNMLFALVILLILFGQIFLLFSQDVKPIYSFSFKNILKKDHFKLFVPFIGYGASSLVTIWVWPILLFLFLPDFVGMGVMAMVVHTISMFVSLFVGAKSDSVSKIKLVKIGTILHGLTVFFRIFVKNIGDAFFIWALGGLVFPILNISFEAFNYEKSKHTDVLEFFIIREGGLMIGRMLIILILFVLVFDPMLAILVSMGAGGIISFLQFFIE